MTVPNAGPDATDRFSVTRLDLANGRYRSNQALLIEHPLAQYFPSVRDLEVRWDKRTGG